MKLSRTIQRKVIVEELKKLTSHPTADELHSIVREIMPHISLGTVYRNLELLAENGDILKLEMGGKQKRFDGNPMPHYHMRCQNCDAVEDLPMNGMSHIESELAEKCRGRISSAKIEFTGFCERCASARFSSMEKQ